MFSPQQQAVIDNFRKGGSAAVNAVAGSGKTATAVGAAQHVPASQQCLAMAFNKRNAEDLAARMPSHITSKTMNAIGHAAWQKHIAKWPKLDTRKLFQIFKAYPHAEELRDDVMDIVKLAKLARHTGITSGYGGQPEPSFDEWAVLADEHDILNAEDLLPHAAWLLKQSCIEAFKGFIDFDDQIYMPVLYGSPFQRYDSIIIDEAQDLSPLQHRMAERSVKQGGQVTVLGDPNQAIYHFRGADSDSFHALVRKFNLQELPLTASFRCPRAVIREAQKYVPHIEAAGQLEGRVSLLQPSPTPDPKLTVLSRTNAPLIALAFESIRKRIPVNFLGRDFLSGIKALHKKYPTVKQLDAWFNVAKGEAKSDGALHRLEDRYLTLKALHAEGDVDKAIEVLMDEKKVGSMTLSTIHKFKGMEAETVLYLNYTKRTRGLQENNIRYVGVTRAKRNLVLHGEPQE